MKSSFISVFQITLCSFLGFISTYTGFMGFFFSIGGMWKVETALMMGYTAVFSISTLSLLMLVRKRDWFESLQKELLIKK